jgi:hypothetical protein
MDPVSEVGSYVVPRQRFVLRPAKRYSAGEGMLLLSRVMRSTFICCGYAVVNTQCSASHHIRRC